MSNGAVKNIENLKESFFGNDSCPVWTLYHGFEVKAGNRSCDFEGTAMDDSWAKLESQLYAKCMNGGQFLLFQTDKKSNSLGYKTRFDFSPQRGGYGVPGVAGIGGAPQYLPQPADSITKSEAAEMIKKAVDDAVFRERMERKVEDLEAALTAKNEPDGIGKIARDLVDHPAAAPIIEAIASRLAAPGTTVQMHGYAKGDFQQKVEVETTAVDELQYDHNRVLPVLDQVTDLLGLEDMYLFLEILAWQAETNPGQLKMLFQLQKTEFLQSKKPVE